MGCRYILLGDRRPRSGMPLAEASSRLGSAGLIERHSGAGWTLFASPETPTISLPGGGVLIGHVFLNSGALLRESSALAAILSTGDARSSILTQCWGEYILAQPGDVKANSLRMTRDPSGGVPCVYRSSGDSWFATSDISIATELGLYERRVDWDFISHFLAYPYVKTERTGLAGLRELLPGCTLHLPAGNRAATAAWCPWDFVAPPYRVSSYEQAAARLRVAVEKVVDSWAAVDAAALVELSGGLDSSIVATCLRGSAARVHCITVVPDIPGADERLYADAVARNIGADLHVEALDVADAHFDDPVPPWCVIPGGGPLQNAVDGVMASAAVRENLPCFYSGGGGDTVFGYLGGVAPAADAYKERGLFAAVRAIRHLSELHNCTFWLAAKLTLRRIATSRGHASRATGELLNPARVPTSADPHPWWQAPREALPGDRERVDGLAATQLFRDTLPRGMQGWFRLPLLSQPVMEACLSVPSWMWIHGGVNRAVARAAFSDTLPALVLHRKSKGNFSQYNGAVYRRNKESMRRFLLDGRLQAHELLDADALSAYFKRPLSPRDRSFMRIFDLCRTENWVRHQP